MKPAPILRDTLLGLAYVAAALVLLGRHGVNLTGVVATSAVVTAVIGFSLQDTLGNIMAGVALQMEHSVAIGDWVRVGNEEGIVREIRWRQTSIETRNGDTVVIPNSNLVKSPTSVAVVPTFELAPLVLKRTCSRSGNIGVSTVRV